MPVTRRDFIKSSAVLAAVTSIPRPLLVPFGNRHEPVPPVDDPRLKTLVARALDTARSAGAQYADVRLTHTWQRTIDTKTASNRWSDDESLTVGVRALVNGYWGFSSGPVWSPDEMARLGRESVHQAKANALGKPREVDLVPVSVVSDGHWVMPVKIDPFEISPLEIQDYLKGLEIFALRVVGAKKVSGNKCHFQRQEKAFGSTAGSYYTQQTCLTTGAFEFAIRAEDQNDQGALDLLTPAGLGWELYQDQPLHDRLRQILEEMKQDLKLPLKPVDVGRYDTVLDARSVASLLHETIGPATELDRALGYESNAGGTSYINDPFAMLGSYQAGAPALTVTANRSEPGAAATVKWDDEGVTPDEFTLVKNGVLADFQTTRESAGWLKDYYVKGGMPVRSHGCSAAQTGHFAPMQLAPNLVLAPDKRDRDFDGLVAGLTNGIAVKGLAAGMDFQHSSGLGTGRFYEIKNGKRVSRIASGGILFRATELWKALASVGGKESVRRYGMAAMKGEPGQVSYSSVTAPPAAFTGLTVIDPLRKA